MNDNEKITDYGEIQKYHVKKQWEGKWTELKPNPKTEEFSWTLLNFGAVYRVILCEEVVNFKFPICKSAYAITGKIPPLAILSVGKTTNLSTRMQAHFTPSKRKSNRLLTRLKTIFPKANGRKWLSRMILSEKIKIEYIRIDDSEWWKRDLLESYGKTYYKCLFDLDVEH